MPRGRASRADADRFRRLMEKQRMTELWHFTPLSYMPCILLHGSLFSIEELDRRGLEVPGRESREDDIRKGAGNVVKTSTQPYWHMLSGQMRNGVPHVLIRFSADPVLWIDTTFGDRNIWENGWMRGGTYEFAEQYVFIRKGQYVGGSPPEVYIERELPLAGLARSIYTYLLDETRLLEKCLTRLGIDSPVKLMTAGVRNSPFPDRCHDDYMQNREESFRKTQEYFGTVTIESLHRGVEIEP